MTGQAEGFSAGYDFFEKHASAYAGAAHGQEYVSAVQREIDKLTKDLNSFKGYATDIGALKGDAAEFWHSGTHNIDAVLKGSHARTTVDRSHGFASPDITSSDGTVYGLKYYKSGGESAKAQAVTLYERYREYAAEAGRAGMTVESFEDYLRKRGYDDPELVRHDPIYSGQVRIIPKDQMADAIAWLDRKILAESEHRPEQAHRYQEVRDLLSDRIRTSEGTESIALSKEDSERLAQLAKKGEFRPEEFGLTTEELIGYKYVMQQAFKAGTTAAMIAVVLRVAPEIYRGILHLLREGKIDQAQWKKTGFAALQGGAEGFVRGTVSAAVTTACKAGLWGGAAKAIHPSVIAAVTVMVMDTMKHAFYVSIGRMERAAMIDALARNLFVTACSLTLGGIAQSVIHIPVLGFMLGSFVGSVVGAFAYSTAYSACMSFCVDSGFTMFGLVEQDYRLPEEVLRHMGADVLEYERFAVKTIEIPKIQVPTIRFKPLEYPTIGITLLRRGVIGVMRVGYV